MNDQVRSMIAATTYDRKACQVGVVHIGFGAFHRAHQAVYVDEYMERSGDLNWGIAAVNLRGAEAATFASAADEVERLDGYYLKSFSYDGNEAINRIRSHISFADWSVSSDTAEDLVAQSNVKLITITVTESGYYTDTNGDLNLKDPVIVAELEDGAKTSIYAYLCAGLQKRMAAKAGAVTIACCDNIRQNGKMLHRNVLAYLNASDATELRNWVEDNVTFPCSMVDRITPRSSDDLGAELSKVVGQSVTSPVMAEEFIQWVLQGSPASDLPDLGVAGVTVTDDVDPYEETKIRVLNGGHTALAYLAALEGVETFDAAMRVPHLLEHFNNFETQEVLPAITLDLPFSKSDYLQSITQRFGNRAIGDTVARICADGMAKFPIFIRPTLEGCLRQGHMPVFAIRSIASWHQFARHVAAGQVPFNYVEPSWDQLNEMLGHDSFVVSPLLWGDLPETYPEFAAALRTEIERMELKWPV